MTGLDPLDTHLTGLASALLPYRREAQRLESWATELAWTLVRGGRLLVAGNGGSAAEAQHLTAELVGKLRHDRQPLSAIALHAETSALTAIANDYGYDETFARQVRAHGRPHDILLLLTTSGTSTNLLTAAHAAHQTGLRTWAFTGPAPNPLADLCHDVLAVPSPDSQVVQELHLVSTHLLCEYVDRALPLVRQLPHAPWRPVDPVSVTGRTAAEGGPDRPGWDGLVLAGVDGAAPHGANGHAPNGHAPNGHGLNGRGPNGHATNGHGPNGHGTNGHGTNGFAPANGHAANGRRRDGDTGTGWVQS